MKCRRFWVADRLLHSRANLLFKLCHRHMCRCVSVCVSVCVCVEARIWRHTDTDTRGCIISKCLKGLKSKQQQQKHQHEWNKPPQRFCLGCWWCTSLPREARGAASGGGWQWAVDGSYIASHAPPCLWMFAAMRVHANLHRFPASRSRLTWPSRWKIGAARRWLEGPNSRSSSANKHKGYPFKVIDRDLASTPRPKCL